MREEVTEKDAFDVIELMNFSLKVIQDDFGIDNSFVDSIKTSSRII